MNSIVALCFLSVLISVFGSGLSHDYHPDIKHTTSNKLNRPEEIEPEFWQNSAQDFLREKLNYPKNTNIAKNVILLLGDGMSIATIAATRMLLGGEEVQLSFEKFPYTGLLKTYCIDSQVPDSACTATAYLTGVKANYGTLGVNGRVSQFDCEGAGDEENHSYSYAKWAQDLGKATGFVTTTRITHATPAGLYAHTSNRRWETNQQVLDNGCDLETNPDITHQLVYGDIAKNFKVMLGGGRRTFLNETVNDEAGDPGRRTDGRDYIQEWIEERGENARYVWNRSSLLETDAENTEYLLGMFRSTHTRFHLTAYENGEDEPTLVEMTQKAVEMLDKNENGFFLLVEGGRIDHGHHDTETRKALDETAEFAKAVEFVRERYSEEDTLVVVMADHSHVYTYGGYAARGNDIFGMAGISDEDDLPYMTSTYANGIGYYRHTNPAGGRIDPTTINTSSKGSTFPTTVPMESETHGGDDVAIYASGPFAHLFTGNYEQSFVAHFINYAACYGEGLTACSDDSL